MSISLLRSNTKSPQESYTRLFLSFFFFDKTFLQVYYCNFGCDFALSHFFYAYRGAMCLCLDGLFCSEEVSSYFYMEAC